MARRHRANESANAAEISVRTNAGLSLLLQAGCCELNGTELVIQGNPTDDTISLISNTNQPEFTVSVAGEPSLTATYNNADITKVTVFAGAGNDYVANTIQVPTVIHGQAGNDTLRGGYADDIINGGNGNDNILGRTGNDLLNGQGDDDVISGGSGDDTITGGNGNDRLSGDADDDLLDGQGGDDVLHGGDGSDTLNGSSGDDVLNGNAGVDFLDGGSDNDTLRGNEDSDNLVGGAGNDFLYGGDGSDGLIGGEGDDQLFGQDGHDILHGDVGDDLLYGGGGNDRLFGHAGADELRGQSGDDFLVSGGDQDADQLTGGTGFDEFLILGTVGVDSVDQVLDRFGMEIYAGYAGPLEPSIELDGSSVSVVGSNSQDKYIVDDKFNDGTTTRIELWHSEIGSFNTVDIDEIVFHLNDGNDLLYVYENEVSTPIRAYGGLGDDDMEGGNGNDLLIGDDGNDSLYGRGGDDVISGFNGNDNIQGGDGNDQLNGNTGDDEIGGQDGDDEINGGEGNDLAGGGDGNDFVGGNEGDDRLYGDAGNDSLRGDDGDDRLYGQMGDDSLRGSAGNDTLYGDSGNDLLVGGDGDDYLRGNSDDDILFGSEGRDKLYGDSGDDVLVAGEDDDWDRLWGNGGFDQYFLELVEDHGYGIGSDDPVLPVADAPMEPAFGGGVTMDPPPPPPTDNASIGDLVFEDLDEDGVFDTGEVGLEGIMVHLLQNSNVIATRSTDANGSYLFNDLAAGAYTVELESGSLGTRTITTSNTITATLSEAEQNLAADFGVTIPVDDPNATGSIGDLVYIDVNENGQLDSGEVGLEGVEIQLIQGTTVIQSQTTGSNGAYAFTNVVAGDYVVEVVLDSTSGRQLTTPSVVDVTLVAGESNTEIDFGLEEQTQAGERSDDEAIKDLLSTFAAGANGIVPRLVFESIAATATAPLTHFRKPPALLVSTH